ncbi:bifunctional riboflavin kinase/FAD synthetase [Glaciibacter flavus]|uniref:bifunctional riboflavin kinase/FAD synthetase n=1 Tax=Orlajensenia flava TaxID=2565934 RepID=UPI003B001A0D
MNTFSGLDEVPADWPASVVTIGKFDGVHSGHRAVIRRMLELADAERLASVVVTFDRNPLALLRPELCPVSLVSVEQKLELLARTGIDATVLLAFDEAFAAQTPDEFVDAVLTGVLHARTVLVGADFRYGARGAGTVETLKASGAERGFRVVVVDDVRPDGEHRVSSTWIRRLLDDGDVVAASGLLGHTPSVRGEVVHGAARGRELGYPTANLSPESEGLIPADGVYAGRLIDGGVSYPAAISVGNNPTFEGVPQKQVEAYVIDEDLDLYGHVVTVQFTERIRGQVAFTGIDPLIEQIRDDVERARAILA